ncbi:PAS domain S-box protein [Parasphingopyxis algicola]|uniref:PAS domain-containing sensor histidine kinase n=1 Tax=Parasphingopyxis algicola TaxID=2026624 RepID=UPI00159FEB3F|nr:PAS domain-containing sensor histidine kinase [Parasphingopyxis algicola]QLC23766.1 PAS domain S-box protein [Parasphingopyxis algicola]
MMVNLDPAIHPRIDEEKTVRNALDEVDAFVVSVDSDLHMDEVQTDWAKLTGQSHAEYCGRGWMNAIHGDDIDGTKSEWRRAETGKYAFVRVHRIRDCDGELQRWATKAAPQLDEQGEIASWTVLHVRTNNSQQSQRDPTEAHSSVHIPPLEYSAVLDQLGEGVIVTDAMGQISFVNEAAYALHGVRNLEVDPENYTESYRLFTEEGDPYPTLELPLARAVLRGETVVDERWRIRRPDGSEVLAIGTARPLYDDQGQQLGAVLTMRDDTARHAAEEQLALLNETLETRVNEALDERALVEEALLQAQKMEAVGQLTGGIAHDFNNLLTVISGSIQLLELRLANVDDEKVGRNMTNIGAAAKRAAALTQRLLAFSRRQSLVPHPTDLNALISDVGDMIQRTIGEHIVFGSDLDESIGPIFIDSHQLENVLLNLALNARDAMPAGGQLRFKTEAISVGEHHSDLMPGDYAMISVIDTGTGMDEETIGRAFEPFFTTKEVGKGTGLGLSMIYGFAKQSGGHVEIASEPGVGTTITLYLPAHSEGENA